MFTNNSPSLLVVGLSSIDIVYSGTGETTHYYGGSAANVAIGASRVGTITSFLTCLGDDELSDSYSKYMVENGLDVSSLIRKIGPVAKCFMWSETGEYRLEPGVEASFTLESVPNLRPLNYEWIHLALAPKDVSLQVAALSYRIRTSFNPGFALKNQTYDSSVCFEYPWQILFLNESEVDFLEKNLGDSIETLFRRSLVKTMIITRGAGDVSVFDENGQYITPVYPAKVVDPTGAGDMLISGVISELLKGSRIRNAVATGVALSSIVVEFQGAQAYNLDMSELSNRILKLRQTATGYHSQRQ